MISLVRGISKLLFGNAGNYFVLGYIEKKFNFWRDLYFWMHLNMCCRQHYGDIPNDIPYGVPSHIPNDVHYHIPNNVHYHISNGAP
jgi:hypothetical protein